MIYKDSYSKIFYKVTKHGEVRCCKYPFHTGLRVMRIVRCEIKDDIHCKNIFEACKEIKRLLKKAA